MNEYLTEEKLAERLKMSRSTIYCLRKKGMPFRRVNRMVRYSPEEVERWIFCENVVLTASPRCKEDNGYENKSM